jgi:uncharacterized SAM-binding protein YcdF (DUF218 family)
MYQYFENNLKRIAVASSLFYITTMLHSCAYSSKAAQEIYDKTKTEVYDAVVVPGVPLENGKWSYTMKGRILWAKFLYDKGIAKNIIFSGTAVSSPYIEGIVMGQYAVALGVSKDHVFAETIAEHSTENIYYGYQLANKLGFTKVALASDPFQTKSLKSFSRRKVSPGIVMIPMLTDSVQAMSVGLKEPVIDLSVSLDKNYIPLKEKYGFFKRLKGTMGYGIKKNQQ